MSHLRAVIVFLGSRALTLWLSGAFLLVYIVTALWAGDAFARFVTALDRNGIVIACYLLFSANVLLRVIGSLRSSWDKKALVLLKLPLYAGLVLVLFSFFLSLNLRQQEWMIVGEGDVVRPRWESSAFRVLQVDIPLERKMLVMDDATLFAYEPRVAIGDRSGAVREVGAFPPARVRSSLLHILNFGIGPGIELRKGGDVLHRGEVALKLIPFGSADTFEVPPHPYRFLVSVVPSRTLKKGRETARDYDLERPRYRVEVMKGDRTIARAETDEGLAFDEGMSLRFFRPAAWVLLEAVHDPFRVWFLAGLVLLAGGAVLWPFALFLGRRRPGDRLRSDERF